MISFSRLRVRVREIGDPKGRLLALPSWDIGILWIAGDWRQVTRNGPEIATPIHPTMRSREEIGGAAFSCETALPAPMTLKVNKDIAVPPLAVSFACDFLRARVIAPKSSDRL
jgi:hypothetical protein